MEEVLNTLSTISFIWTVSGYLKIYSFWQFCLSFPLYYINEVTSELQNKIKSGLNNRHKFGTMSNFKRKDKERERKTETRKNRTYNLIDLFFNNNIRETSQRMFTNLKWKFRLTLYYFFFHHIPHDHVCYFGQSKHDD